MNKLSSFSKIKKNLQKLALLQLGIGEKKKKDIISLNIVSSSFMKVKKKFICGPGISTNIKK